MPLHNALIAALPCEVYDRLSPAMKTVHLTSGEILHRPNQLIEDVYFPIGCLISITVTMSGAATSEAAMVGSREMVGVNAFMGGRETNQTEYICQSPGRAVKLPAGLLLDEFDRVKAVRDVMLRFTQAYIAQLSQNVACNRLHDVEHRMARWLLECRDRLQTEDLGVTHEFLSQMLGVRRQAVTETLAKLRVSGLIAGSRGKTQITDSPGLEKASCECYGVLLEEYTRLLSLDHS